MPLTTHRILLAVGLAGLLAIAFPGLAAGEKKPSPRAEARAISNKVINANRASTKRFSRAQFSSQFKTDLNRRIKCWEEISTKSSAAISSEEESFVVSFFLFTLASVDVFYLTIKDQEKLISAERQRIVSQAARWSKPLSQAKSRAVLGAWRARGRQHSRLQKIARGVNFDSCRLEDFIEDNDGYQSAERLQFLIVSWLSEAAEFPDLAAGSKATRRDQRRIDRGIKIMRWALGRKKARRVESFVSSPLFSLLVAGSQRQYPRESLRSARLQIRGGKAGLDPTQLLAISRKLQQQAKTPSGQ